MRRFARAAVLPLLLAALAPAGPEAGAQGVFYTVAVTDNRIRQVDLSTGATVSFKSISVPGLSITQVTALAVDPTNSKMYAVVSAGTTQAGRLITVNPATGQGVSVGLLGDRFAGLAFDLAGQLYGVTGDGGTVPEALYAIDKANASKTLVQMLGNGGNGETIAFQPGDGLLYHASGLGALNDAQFGQILETVDLATQQVTPVTLTGAPVPVGMLFLARRDIHTFLTADQASNVYTVTTSGQLTFTGATLDHLPKGGAFLPGPSFYVQLPGGCAGAGGVPQLSGSGTPNPGQSTTVTLSQAAPSAPALLLFGIGQSPAQVVGACALQIAPILPVMLPLGVPPGGTLALPATIPANTPPADVFLQVLIADPSAQDGVAASNPLRMHVQ